MRTVDLFSGCGGMSLGFQSAGYNIVAAFENWPAAIECYKQNIKHPVIETDLSIVDEAIIRIKKYQPDLIIGGPPCQDFSNAGNRTEGERAELTHSFAKIITAVKPKFFVMENVARASESEAYKKARKLFIDNGYGLTEIAQVDKYFSALTKILKKHDTDEDFEIIVLLGKRLDGEKVDHDIESKHLRQLAEVNTRILYYDQLLANAETLYADFIAQNSSLASLETLINSIE